MSEIERTMPPAFSSPTAWNGPSIVSSPTSAVIDQALCHVGSQFYAEIETSKATIIAKTSGSNATTRRPKDESCGDAVLEKYLQTVSRVEILCLGIQTTRSSRVFDHHLIRKIDELLLLIEVVPVEEALSLSS